MPLFSILLKKKNNLSSIVSSLFLDVDIEGGADEDHEVVQTLTTRLGRAYRK